MSILMKIWLVVLGTALVLHLALFHGRRKDVHHE